MVVAVISKKNLQQIGTILNNIRTHENVSQEALADMLEGKQSAISRLESNKRIPSVPTLISYLDKLGYELVIQKKHR